MAPPTVLLGSPTHPLWRSDRSDTANRPMSHQRRPREERRRDTVPLLLDVGEPDEMPSGVDYPGFRAIPRQRRDERVGSMSSPSLRSPSRPLFLRFGSRGPPELLPLAMTTQSTNDWIREDGTPRGTGLFGKCRVTRCFQLFGELRSTALNNRTIDKYVNRVSVKFVKEPLEVRNCEDPEAPFFRCGLNSPRD